MTFDGAKLVEVDAKFARSAMLAVLDYEIEHFDALLDSFPEELALCAVVAEDAVLENSSEKAEAILDFLKDGTPTGFRRSKEELLALRDAIAEDDSRNYRLEYNGHLLKFSNGTAFADAALNELKNASAPEIKTVFTIRSHWENPASCVTISYSHQARPEILKILGNYPTTA